MTPSKKEILEARAELWRQGDISWKLEPHQKELYDSYHTLIKNKEKIVFWNSSRRIGKSFCLLIIAIETALQKGKSVIKYAAPQQAQVREILDEIMPIILEDCPASLMPNFKERRNAWYFPNGSKIQMVGVGNKRYNRLRGGSAQLCIIDECGFMDDLKIIINSVLMPTTTTTGGKILMATTPPDEADHASITYMENAELKGNLIIKTIEDYFVAFQKIGKEPKRMTRAKLDEIIQEYPMGEEDVDYRREYFCELNTASDLKIVPEFTPAIEKRVVKKWPRPVFYHPYAAMDIGATDLTVVLFAYYDFFENKVIIEDEYVINGPELTTDVLANAIRKIEEKLWIHPVNKMPVEVYKRISDTNQPILLNDLWSLHGIKFDLADKDDADAQRNYMRQMIRNEQIIINPQCTTLVNHLKYGKWKKNRKDYARTTKYGHYDALDALRYLVRNMNFNKNPYPKGYNVPKGQGIFISPHNKDDKTEAHEFFQEMFRVKKRF